MFRWGILSTAKIAREQVIPAIVEADNGVLAGIASRDVVRARQVAERFRANWTSIAVTQRRNSVACAEDAR